MHLFSLLALASGSQLIGSAFGSPVLARVNGDGGEPTVVRPGNEVVITSKNTLNATNANPSSSVSPQAGGQQLPIQLVNEIGDGPVSAYITGLDPSGALVFVQPNGKFYYPSAKEGDTNPQRIPDSKIAIALGKTGSQMTVTLPDYLESGRVYFSEGALKFFTTFPSGAPGPTLVQPAPNNPDDPSAGVEWGFVELTTTSGGIYADLSNVDFVGLILAMTLKTGDGKTMSAKGLKPGSLQSICDAMTSAGKSDGQPWGKLCQVDGKGKALRVLSPSDYLSIDSSAFSDYWTGYINKVYNKFSSNPLTIVTPSNGKVTCKTKGGAITCDGDNHSYTKPAAIDIFGCNTGPFQVYSDANSVHKEVYPRICAAFNRATFLIKGGNVQPSVPASKYYMSEPDNLYSKFVHKYSVDGTGYAFAYDDVTPSGGSDQAGLLQDANPKMLTITVGGKNA